MLTVVRLWLLATVLLAAAFVLLVALQRLRALARQVRASLAAGSPTRTARTVLSSRPALDRVPDRREALALR